MGLGVSIHIGGVGGSSVPDRLAQKRNRQIEHLIEQDKMADIKTIKLLLLGNRQLQSMK